MVSPSSFLLPSAPLPSFTVPCPPLSLPAFSPLSLPTFSYCSLRNKYRCLSSLFSKRRRRIAISLSFAYLSTICAKNAPSFPLSYILCRNKHVRIVHGSLCTIWRRKAATRADTNYSTSSNASSRTTQTSTQWSRLRSRARSCVRCTCSSQHRTQRSRLRPVSQIACSASSPR